MKHGDTLEPRVEELHTEIEVLGCERGDAMQKGQMTRMVAFQALEETKRRELYRYLVHESDRSEVYRRYLTQNAE